MKAGVLLSSFTQWMHHSSVALALTAVISACAGFASAEPAAVTLVEEGKPASVIVLPASAARPHGDPAKRMEDLAAGLLVDHIERMSGAKLPIVREEALVGARVADGRVYADSGGAENFILVGDTALAGKLGVTSEGLEPGGMLLKTSGNALILLGPPDGLAYSGGTIFASVTFLEGLGCRYLWPGELGKVVPKQQTVVATPVDQRFNPIIKQRNFRSHGTKFDRVIKGAELLGLPVDQLHQKREEALEINASYIVRGNAGWDQWQCLGGDLQIKGGHAFGQYWDKYGQQHPDWFALQPNGSRTQQKGERARLCVSNPGLVEHIANDIIARVNQEPNTLTVSLSPNDGGPDVFCMCDACKALDAPEGEVIKDFRGWNMDYVSLTDRYVHFWNAIAEKVVAKHPKLMFTIDAYSYYSAPPVKRALHPNMIVRYVPANMEGWDAWRKNGSKIFWRPNIFAAPWAEGTLLFNRRNASDLKYAAHNGAVATDFDSILHNWSTHGLMYYVLARLNWNPDLEMDAIIDDYCQAGFGPAGPAVREYFRGVEALMAKWDPAEASRRRDELAVSHRVDPFAMACTPEVVAGLRASLDAADQAAGEDEQLRRRIAFLRDGLDWSDVQAQGYRLVIDLKRGKPVDLEEAERVLQKRKDLILHLFNNSPLAVNVSYIAYGDHSRWVPLQKAVEASRAERPDKKAPAAKPKTEIDADDEGQPIVVPAR